MVAHKGRDDGASDEGDADTHTYADADANTDEPVAKDYAVGHRRPPKTKRFSKGTSGNPRGRPKGSKTKLPYEAVLGRKVTIRKDGREQQVTAEEAFLMQIGKAGIDGDGPAARATLAVLEGVNAKQAEEAPLGPIAIHIMAVAPGSVTTALESLRMARRLDAFRDSARILLEPWIVEAALKRLGARRLSEADQQVVFAATRTPHKVNWPMWWGVKG